MKKAVAKYYRIKSSKIVQTDFPTRIVFISDLHNVGLGEDNEILLNKIVSLSPDLVLLGGDTIVAKPQQNMDVGLEFIRKLGSQQRVYAANGNHEYRLKIYPNTYQDMYEHYLASIQESGIILLENEHESVEVKGTKIVLHGLELDRKYYARFKREELSQKDLTAYLGKVDDEAYHILLAHNPRYGQAYMQWGADLTLCGHYHGGIIRLPKDLPLIGNDFQLFPKYAYGHHDSEGRHLITSAGIGEHTVPLRINNPRELVVVDLISENNK